MGNDVARDIHCDITMGNDIAQFVSYVITMHNDVAMPNYDIAVSPVKFNCGTFLV